MTNQTPAPLATFRKSVFALFLFSLLLLPSLSQAQASNARAINLLAYNELSEDLPTMEFTFEDLGDRKVIEENEFDFFSQEEIELRFELLIDPSGNVKYVKPLACPTELREHRKGGITALYQTRFNRVGGDDDQKVKVNVRFRKVE